ncbi:hypothetical protein [Enterovibrio baiacu]|uniref:hypothetical protein n=1 Tax=Enterovibrio baiacu TaxID=2491023 RepID=UPI001013AE44|nr:hypothetical protein [Enterovibrio baiacu]MBE1275106.1 hypothetical protein [Enterovibrio baiacu]
MNIVKPENGYEIIRKNGECLINFKGVLAGAVIPVEDAWYCHFNANTKKIFKTFKNERDAIDWTTAGCAAMYDYHVNGNKKAFLSVS